MVPFTRAYAPTGVAFLVDVGIVDLVVGARFLELLFGLGRPASEGKLVAVGEVAAALVAGARHLFGFHLDPPAFADAVARGRAVRGVDGVVVAWAGGLL